MFIVSNKYKFIFNHYVKNGIKFTVCVCSDLEKLGIDNKPGQAIEISLSHCKPRDQFYKIIGRKISLTRILKTLPLHDSWFEIKENRKLVWKEYFKFFPKGKSKC